MGKRSFTHAKHERQNARDHRRVRRQQRLDKCWDLLIERRPSPFGSGNGSYPELDDLTEDDDQLGLFWWDRHGRQATPVVNVHGVRADSAGFYLALLGRLLNEQRAILVIHGFHRGRYWQRKLQREFPRCCETPEDNKGVTWLRLN